MLRLSEERASNMDWGHKFSHGKIALIPCKTELDLYSVSACVATRNRSAWSLPAGEARSYDFSYNVNELRGDPLPRIGWLSRGHTRTTYYKTIRFPSLMELARTIYIFAGTGS